jgi:anti-anti-sigma factor
MQGFAVRRKGDAFRLIGEFDLASVETFARETEELPPGWGAIVLDLAELTFIDSSGLQAIFHLARRCGDRGVLLRSPSAWVAKVFEIVRMGEIRGIRIVGGAQAVLDEGTF